MIEAIRKSATERGITRLCHFTPSRNLAHIIANQQGVLASRHLESDERAIFNPTDVNRYDGFPDHVCCSIQYPNAWYFKRARGNERLFQDWVILLIKPDHLWMDGAKFCPRNAAAHMGRDVAEGPGMFEKLFAANVDGAQGRTYSRGPSHPTWLPTDEQAEVLIPDRIALADVLGVAAMSRSQGKTEIARLRQLNQRVPPFLIAPHFYNPQMLSNTLRTGGMPAEILLYKGDTYA